MEKEKKSLLPSYVRLFVRSFVRVAVARAEGVSPFCSLAPSPLSLPFFHYAKPSHIISYIYTYIYACTPNKTKPNWNKKGLACAASEGAGYLQIS